MRMLCYIMLVSILTLQLSCNRDESNVYQVTLEKRSGAVNVPTQHETYEGIVTTHLIDRKNNILEIEFSENLDLTPLIGFSGYYYIDDLQDHKMVIDFDANGQASILNPNDIHEHYYAWYSHDSLYLSIGYSALSFGVGYKFYSH